MVLRRYFLLLSIMLLGFLGYWHADNPCLSHFILQARSASDSNPSSCKFQPCFKFRSKYHKDVFGKDISRNRAAPLIMVDGHWRCSESSICLIDPIKLREITSQKRGDVVSWLVGSVLEIIPTVPRAVLWAGCSLCCFLPFSVVLCRFLGNTENKAQQTQLL